MHDDDSKPDLGTGQADIPAAAAFAATSDLNSSAGLVAMQIGPRAGGPAARSQAEPDGREAADSFLVTPDYKSTHASGKSVRLAACGCRSWFCNRCCIGKGGELRQRVQWIVDRFFTHLLFVTLTINPRRFSSPWEAYVRGSARIARFMRRLKRDGYLISDRWFRVLEVHQNGWPHFHVLVDAEFIPIDALHKAWNGSERTERTKRDPEWGIVDVRSGKTFESRAHAVNYITSYVTKLPECGWPDWILGTMKRIRRYQASQGFWGELKAAHPNATAFNVDELERQPGERRRRLPAGLTHGQRCGTCGGKVVAHVVTENVQPDGEIRESRKFVGYLGDALYVWAEQLHVLLEEGSRSLTLAYDEGVVEFLKLNCIWKALKKYRLDEKMRRFREAERARSAPIVQQSLWSGPPDAG
jgi:hypothetical protein